jgi:hypothetical protein
VVRTGENPCPQIHVAKTDANLRTHFPNMCTRWYLTVPGHAGEQVTVNFSPTLAGLFIHRARLQRIPVPHRHGTSEFSPRTAVETRIACGNSPAACEGVRRWSSILQHFLQASTIFHRTSRHNWGLPSECPRGTIATLYTGSASAGTVAAALSRVEVALHVRCRKKSRYVVQARPSVRLTACGTCARNAPQMT